jgi:hypothetical protein
MTRPARRARSFEARPHAASACPSSRTTQRRDPLEKHRRPSRWHPPPFSCATPSYRISGPLDAICMTNGITRRPVRSMLPCKQTKTVVIPTTITRWLLGSRRRPTSGDPRSASLSARHDYVEGAGRLDVEPRRRAGGRREGEVRSVRPARFRCPSPHVSEERAASSVTGIVPTRTGRPP